MVYMTQQPVPRRISDAERDAAIEMLRQHFEAGRLNADEFAERMGFALGAKVASELESLFTDLPEPRPGAAEGVMLPWTAPQPPAKANTELIRWARIIQGVVWPVAILLGFITGNFWQFILVALVASAILRGVLANHRTPPPELDK